MATKIYDNQNNKDKTLTAQQRIDAGQMPQYAENGLFHSSISAQNILFKTLKSLLKNN